MHTLSVVIPARNAASTLRQQLDALASQVADVDWDVVVADNGSTDGTRALAESFAGRLEITVVDASGVSGAGATRNVGAGAARGDRLLFTDADDVVAPGWIAAHAQHDHELATGPTPPLGDGNVPQWHFDEMAPSPPTLLRFKPYAPGTNIAISRELFEELGRFDEWFEVGEDVELSWRAQLHGVELAFVPGAVVAHRSRRTAAQFRQYRRYGCYDVALYRRFRAWGVPPMSARETIRSYVGILARVPLLWKREIRSKLMRQLGRRVGRIAGSVRWRVLYL